MYAGDSECCFVGVRKMTILIRKMTFTWTGKYVIISETGKNLIKYYKTAGLKGTGGGVCAS